METRTSVQMFGLLFGIVNALVGQLGFVPSVLQPPPADARAWLKRISWYSPGIFPVNGAHNVVHIVTGLVGIVSMARGFNATLGFIPIYGADVALHALTMLPVSYSPGSQPIRG